MVDVEYIVAERDDTMPEQWISNDEVMNHLRLPEWESSLDVYRLAAISEAEQYMNRFILPNTVINVSSNLNEFKMPCHATPTSIENADGKSAQFSFNKVTKRVKISGQGPFMIVANAGWSTVENVPNAIKLAVLTAIATAYENRESVSNGVSLSLNPFNHERLLKLYRLIAGYR